LVCAPNPSAKEKWLEAIREQLTEVKKTLNTSTMSAKEFENMIKKATPKPVENKSAAPSGTSGPGIGGPMNVQRVGGQGPNLLDQFKTQPSARQMTTTPIAPPTNTTSTADSRGQPPPPPGNPNIRGDWEKILDESSGDYYYENLKTGLTQWEEPDGWNAPASVSKGPPPPPPNTVRQTTTNATPSTNTTAKTQATVQPVKQTTTAVKQPATPSNTSDSHSRPVPQAPGLGSTGESRGPPPPPPMGNDTGSSYNRGPPPPPPGQDAYTAPAIVEAPANTGPAPGSLQDQINKAKAGGLKKAQVVKRNTVVQSPGGLNQALKQSLDRYRKFVQDDEDDIDQAKEDEGWD
jgi:hypothetical protein